MKLELKHLAPYLPYGLLLEGDYTMAPFMVLVYDYKQDEERPMRSLFFALRKQTKPILRPLSDLTEQIEHNGERFVPVDWFEIGEENDVPEFDNGNIKLCNTLQSIGMFNVTHDINYLPHYVVGKLLEWHFDVDNLIENDLAIDVNTLETNPYQ